MESSMTFRDVNGEQARLIVEGLEADVVVKRVHFSPNANMDGKGTITIIYEEKPPKPKPHWLTRWGKWRKHR